MISHLFGNICYIGGVTIKNNTLKFLGYYLAPFVLNCVGVFIIWHTKTAAVVYISMAVILLGNMLWAWFTPNESALPTAFLVAASWSYAWFLLQICTLSIVATLGFWVFGFWCAIVGFVWALLIGNRYMRFNNEKRRNAWRIIVTPRELITLVSVLLILSCAVVAFFWIRVLPASPKNNEVWIDYSEYEQMSKG